MTVMRVSSRVAFLNPRKSKCHRNLGDVIEEEDSIYGDGVNIAARLESLAQAGGICISGSAWPNQYLSLNALQRYL